MKKFEDYIITNNKRMVTLKDYQSSPAVAFLKYIVDAKDASVSCTRKFKNSSRKKPYTNDALHSIYIINAGLLAAIMGNFETFQKYLFATMFDYSIYLKNFQTDIFIKSIKESIKVAKSTEFEVDFVRLAAYRDTSISVGFILADQLKYWQSPSIVNRYFKAFGMKEDNPKIKDFYSNDEKEVLSVLWQMRHSIVHTASTITLPDSQKVSGLQNFGEKTISLDNQFIYEVARKLHPLIKESTTRMSNFFMGNLKGDVTEDVRNSIAKLFKVSSSCPAWLR